MKRLNNNKTTVLIIKFNIISIEKNKISDIIVYRFIIFRKENVIMEKNVTKTKTKRNKGQLVVKVMASLMAVLMIFSVAISLIYYFI